MFFIIWQTKTIFKKQSILIIKVDCFFMGIFQKSRQKKSASIPFVKTPIVQDLSARPIRLPPVFRLIPITQDYKACLNDHREHSLLNFFCWVYQMLNQCGNIFFSSKNSYYYFKCNFLSLVLQIISKDISSIISNCMLFSWLKIVFYASIF